MITNELRVRLGAAIEEYVTPLIRLFENDLSGVNDVKNYYFIVADVLQHKGVPDDEILRLFHAHKGNYLLLKKYSVSATDFAGRLLERMEEEKTSR